MSTAIMDITTQRIVDGADELFWRYGVKSITMDDISKSIGMSKKTIYQHFEDKDALVNIVVRQRLDHQEMELQMLHATAIDPIDEILKIASHLNIMFQGMNPSLLFEIQKYHPIAYDIFLQHKEEKIFGMLVDNFQWGKKTGLYRPECHVELLSKMRLDQVEWGFRPELFNRFTLSVQDLHIQLIEHYLYGICTLKGHKLINKYKQIQEEE
ncbi:MAG: TetR/AcrR family transcriptional regulator [Cytophagaceae bacterium]|jgi:AcrR family transcriptional regulator|nr:TetR/AcrR family transcriptional regulator [Cytophagaceae bacterium]